VKRKTATATGHNKLRAWARWLLSRSTVGELLMGVDPSRETAKGPTGPSGTRPVRPDYESSGNRGRRPLIGITSKSGRYAGSTGRARPCVREVTARRCMWVAVDLVQEVVDGWRWSEPVVRVEPKIPVARLERGGAGPRDRPRLGVTPKG